MEGEEYLTVEDKQQKGVDDRCTRWKVCSFVKNDGSTLIIRFLWKVKNEG